MGLVFSVALEFFFAIPLFLNKEGRLIAVLHGLDKYIQLE